MPRLGSAIASTILSLFSAVSLVGVDKAQAAVLHYDFTIENGFHVGDGFFKVDNSSLTGIGYESIAVSEGILNMDFHLSNVYGGARLYLRPLGGANAVFYQGELRGLEDSRSESSSYQGSTITASWYFDIHESVGLWSWFTGYYQQLPCNSDSGPLPDLYCTRDWQAAEVYYTLVDTEPSPVPEPLTAGGTALALAGLSWLKHKKKMAA